MIHLEIEPYCHNCQAFEPTAIVTRSEGENGVYELNTAVQCHSKRRCMAVEKYLRREIAKNGVQRDEPQSDSF